jgi:protoporphyrinogen/coproporphyrinogen III oxidase
MPEEAPTFSSRGTLPVAVVGAGVSGLAAAYALAKTGRPVRLFETGPRLGGAVKSERAGEWLIEAGPNSLQVNDRHVAALLVELGLASKTVDANPSAKKRFLVRGGRVLPAPNSPLSLASTPLLKSSAKLRLLTEFTYGPRRRVADVSLQQLVLDHFGQDIVDYALNPMVAGVYAGDPAKLSARHAFPMLWEAEQTHGSLLRGLIARAKRRRREGHPKSKIVSFQDGLEIIPRALASALPSGTIEQRARIETLFPGKPWRVVWSRDGVTTTESFSDVILAAPAYALAELSFGALGERPLAALSAIEYPPVASLFLGYLQRQVKHPLDGFGVLIPEKERKNVLGVLFSSTLFPNRAPDSHVALTVMIGGSRQPELARLPTSDLLPLVQQDVQDLLGVAGDPVFVRHNVWPRAIPQYQLGYERFLEAISRCETDNPGLVIAGHTRDGIALPACLLSGLRAATRVLQR